MAQKSTEKKKKPAYEVRSAERLLKRQERDLPRKILEFALYKSSLDDDSEMITHVYMSDKSSFSLFYLVDDGQWIGYYDSDTYEQGSFTFATEYHKLETQAIGEFIDTLSRNERREAGEDVPWTADEIVAEFLR